MQRVHHGCSGRGRAPQPVGHEQEVALEVLPCLQCRGGDDGEMQCIVVDIIIIVIVIVIVIIIVTITITITTTTTTTPQAIP